MNEFQQNEADGEVRHRGRAQVVTKDGRMIDLGEIRGPDEIEVHYTSALKGDNLPWSVEAHRETVELTLDLDALPKGMDAWCEMLRHPRPLPNLIFWDPPRVPKKFKKRGGRR